MERGEIKVAFKKIPAAAFALVFLLIACSIISEHFWTGENLFNLGLQGTVLAILALAQTMVILAEGIDLGADNLPLDVIQTVGPGGHYLAQEHTRHKVRELWIPELTNPRPVLGGDDLPDIRRRARAELDRILDEYEPEPLGQAERAELEAILEAAAQDIGY